MRINNAACRIACPKVETRSLDFISNGLTINFRRLIRDSARPFYVWTWATGCSTSMPIDMQYLLKAWEVNSPYQYGFS